MEGAPALDLGKGGPQREPLLQSNPIAGDRDGDLPPVEAQLDRLDRDVEREADGSPEAGAGVRRGRRRVAARQRQGQRPPDDRRGVGIAEQQRGEAAAAAVVLDRHAQPALAQQVGEDGRQGAVVVGVDPAPEPAADLVGGRAQQRLRRRLGLGRGRHPNVDAVVLGVGADVRLIAPGQLVQQLGHRRLADAQGPDVDRADRTGGEVRRQPGQHLLLPHPPHLARHAGHRDDHRTGVADEPAGGGADRVRQQLGRGDGPGLLGVPLRHRQAAAGEEGPDPVEDGGVDDRRLADHLGDRLPRQVVVGRADAAGADDEIGVRGGVADGRHQPRQVVADLDDVEQLDPPRRQLLGEEGGVGVGQVALDQLAADREDVGAHRSPQPARRAHERGKGAPELLRQERQKSPSAVRDRGEDRVLGTLGGDRTPNLLVRSQTLYPLSYEGEFAGGPADQEYSSRSRTRH